jgi:hypothetical protein
MAGTAKIMSAKNPTVTKSVKPACGIALPTNSPAARPVVERMACTAMHAVVHSTMTAQISEFQNPDTVINIHAAYLGVLNHHTL